jgi:hypothetical protein
MFLDKPVLREEHLKNNMPALNKGAILRTSTSILLVHQHAFICDDRLTISKFPVSS